MNPSSHTDLLCPGEDDVFLQQVCVVKVLEDDGNARQQLDLMQLHDALEASQQILLGLLVVVAELRRNQMKSNVSVKVSVFVKCQLQPRISGRTRRKWRLYFLIWSRMFSLKSSSLRMRGPMAFTSRRSASAKISLSAPSMVPLSFLCCE